MSLSRRTSYLRRPSCLRAVSKSQVGLLESCMVLACRLSILWLICWKCCCICPHWIPNWNALSIPDAPLARAPKPDTAPMVPVPAGPPNASCGEMTIPCPAIGAPQGFGKGTVLGIPKVGTVGAVAAGGAAGCCCCCRASHSVPLWLIGVPHFLLAYLS